MPRNEVNATLKNVSDKITDIRSTINKVWPDQDIVDDETVQVLLGRVTDSITEMNKCYQLSITDNSADDIRAKADAALKVAVKRRPRVS